VQVPPDIGAQARVDDRPSDVTPDLDLDRRQLDHARLAGRDQTGEGARERPGLRAEPGRLLHV
jgi:hypothetical protein